MDILKGSSIFFAKIILHLMLFLCRVDESAVKILVFKFGMDLIIPRTILQKVYFGGKMLRNVVDEHHPL